MGEHIGSQPAVVQAPTPEEPLPMTGAECKAIRERLKLTQQEFADQLGVCRHVVWRGERDAPSVLLARAVQGLLIEETLARLRLQVQQQEETTRCLTLPP